MANNFFPKLNFMQFMNRNIKILSGRLYSPSLKNVGWIEEAQLIFHTFVCNFFSCATPSTLPNLLTNVWKIRKINYACSSQATSFIRLLSILTLRFINCVKFNFGKSYLPLDSHTKTVISDRFAYTHQDGDENHDKAY